MTERKSAPRLLILSPHRPKLDPRFKWIYDTAIARGSDIYIIAADNDEPTSVIEHNESKNFIEIVIQRNSDYINYLNHLEVLSLNKITGYWIQLFQNILNSSSKEPFFSYNSQVLIPYSKYFLEIASTLFIGGDQIKDMDAIIAADLFTLIPGILLSKKYDIPLIYDAHEYWPFSTTNFTDYEIDFFQTLEHDLVQFTNICMTVSKPLADIMSKDYKKTFLIAPNAEMANAENLRVIPSYNRVKNCENVYFLFQGGFAPGRGLELLIENWDATHPKAHLYMRGPYWSYVDDLKKMADKKGLLDKRIFFLEKVSENELCEVAANADVGIIPYQPEVSINNKYCCPNKLSQYMVSGLPILTNDLPFLNEILTDANCGYSVDFYKKDEFVKLVNLLAADTNLRLQFGKNARKYFETSFHWEVLTNDIFNTIETLIKNDEHFKNRDTKKTFDMPTIIEGIKSVTTESSQNAASLVRLNNEEFLNLVRKTINERPDIVKQYLKTKAIDMLRNPRIFFSRIRRLLFA